MGISTVLVADELRKPYVPAVHALGVGSSVGSFVAIFV
jgi:hypothetical protein